MKTKVVFTNILFLLIMNIGFSQAKSGACSSPEHRQFDFWIGDWKVYNPQGVYVGSNTIKLIQDSCVLQENWVGAKGYTGTSYNFYDSTSQEWSQLWLDNNGGNLKLKGKFINGSMVLQSQEKYSESNKTHYIDRISWTPNEDGTVRQHWEKSTNKGQSWKTVFDGLYKKD